MDIIKTTQEYIKQRFLSELKQEDGYYRYTHSLRVAGICRKIAQAEGLDEEMLVLGGMLHDIGYVACKTKAEFTDHGLKSAEIAGEFPDGFFKFFKDEGGVFNLHIVIQVKVFLDFFFVICFTYSKQTVYSNIEKGCKCRQHRYVGVTFAALPTAYALEGYSQKFSQSLLGQTFLSP